MSRAKSWSESQQPDNQYTYGQYWFNVIAMLLIALALIAVLIYLLWPQPQASTKVFLVRPETGSEVRSIPFQKSDFDGLKNSFVENEVMELDSFNDKASFEQVIVNLKDRLNGSSPTTAIVVCSAIGAVGEEGHPILRTTTSKGGNIEVKEFLTDFVSAVDCERYIVILDCGHDYSRPLKYFKDSKFQPGDDFNKFTTAVQKLVETGDLTEQPLAVILANGDGEVPLYSYNKRRTLFGLALQDVFSKSHHETVDSLCTSLVEYCRLHGGGAAQTPQVFKSQKFVEGKLRIAGLSVLKSESDEKEDEPEEGESEEDIKFQVKATTDDLKKIVGFWTDRDDVESNFETKEETLLLPEDFETLKWERAINAIVEQTANLRNQEDLGEVNFGDLERGSKIRAARGLTQKFPGLLSSIELDIDPAIQSNSSEVDPRAKRDIQKAFLDYHRTKLKAKYHMAIFESLSWIDGSTSLNRYREEIDELTSVLSNSLFSNSLADEKDWSLYVKAGQNIADQLENVEGQLERLCEFLGGDDKDGFTREMALMCLLDSPLIKPGSSAEDAVNEPYTREGLMDALKQEVVGSGDRLTPDKRIKNSDIRYRLLSKLEKEQLCTLPAKFEVGSRKQDSIAYYMDVGRSKLLDLKVNPKPTVYNLVLENRSELVSTKQIELDGTEINLGLIVKANSEPVKTDVDVVCELPANAPFKILNGIPEKGNKVRIKNRDGLIKVKATENAAKDGMASGYALKVQVGDSYLGERFAINEARSIEIPLALPGEDRIELMLAMAGNKVDGSTLRPLPNRDEVLEMSLVNFFHETRTVKATLYACKSVQGHAIMPGSIDETVKQKTLDNIGRLPVIAVSVPVKLDKGKPRQQSKPAQISWASKPDPEIKMMEAGKSFDQGLLCRVVDVGEGVEADASPKDFWIPVFPEDGDLFSKKNLLLDPNTGDVRLVYEKSELGKDKAINLVCRLGDQVVGKLSIPAGKNAGRDDVIIEKWGRLESKSDSELLNIDVNQWPRRYSFTCENGRFLDTLTSIDSKSRFPNIAFDVEAPKPAAGGIRLKKFTSDDNKVRQAFGYKKKEADRTIEGVLKITCNAQEHFRFPDSKDFVEVKFGNDREKFFFPREVKDFISVDAVDPTRLILLSTVTDFSKNLKVEMDNYDIDPIVIQTGDPREMTGRDITRIVFDNQPPKPPRFQIGGGTIYPGRFIEIQGLSQVVDSPAGVGVSKKIQDRIRAKIRLEGEESKKAVLGYNSRRLLGIKAGKPGNYQLSIEVFDSLKNISKATTKSFRVVPKPPPKKKRKPKVVKAAPPKPVTHVLKVKVRVSSQPLKAGEEPELVIEPDEGVKMKRTGPDTFEFTGLKAGETYSVSGKFKLTTGFKVETQGKTTPWETSKDWPTKHTMPKTLKLIEK